MLHDPIKTGPQSDMFGILPFHSKRRTVFINGVRERNLKQCATPIWPSAITGCIEHGSPSENAKDTLIALGFISLHIKHVATIASAVEEMPRAMHLFLSEVEEKRTSQFSLSNRKFSADPNCEEIDIDSLIHIINRNRKKDGTLFVLVQNLQIYYPNII